MPWSSSPPVPSCCSRSEKSTTGLVLAAAAPLVAVKALAATTADADEDVGPTVLPPLLLVLALLSLLEAAEGPEPMTVTLRAMALSSLQGTTSKDDDVEDDDDEYCGGCCCCAGGSSCSGASDACAACALV